MSNSWEELIDRYNQLTESYSDKFIPDKLFSRIILCSANRGILAANTDLDFRLETMSGHTAIDAIEDNSLVQVLLSLVDMAEMESTNPTLGKVSPFYVDQRFIHYIPWGFDVVRDHVSAIAKKIHKNPKEEVPIEDLIKFEALLRRLSTITIQFRLHIGKVKNLNYQFSLATNQLISPYEDTNLRNTIEREVLGECEIVRQLVEVGKTRMNIASGKVSFDTAMNDTSIINRTFRW